MFELRPGVEMLVSDKEEKGGDNPGKVFVGGRGGRMQIQGPARQPMSLQ